MANERYKTNWWESAAYKYIRDDIKLRLPDHIRKIESATLEIIRNAWKPRPSSRCESHNIAIIEQQLNKVQERFQRWAHTLLHNGDASRWEQIPGIKYYARYNWRAILPGPCDNWNHHLQAFGFGLDYGNTSFPGPEPVVNSYHIAHPDPPTFHAFQPTGAFSAGIPASHGTFGHPGTSPSSAPAGYNTFQHPGHFPGSTPTCYGTIGPHGTFPPHGPAGYNTFQPPGHFHNGFPTGHGTFGHPASDPFGYNTFQPQRAFPANGPNDHDTSQPPRILPSTASTNHRPAKATGSLPTNAPVSSRPPKTTEQVPASAATDPRRVEPAGQLPANAATDPHPAKPIESLPIRAPAGGRALEPKKKIYTYIPFEERKIERDRQGAIAASTDHGTSEPTRSSHIDAHTSHRAIESAGNSAAHPLTDHHSREAGPLPTGLFPAAGLSSSGTRAVTSRTLADSLLADLLEVNYFSGSKTKTSGGTCDVTHRQPLHREIEEPAAQPTSTPFPVGKSAAKRDRSPPTLMDAEEQVACLRAQTKTHKKQRVDARDPITNSSPPDAMSPGEKESIDTHLESKEKHRTNHSSSLEETKDVPGRKSAIRRLGIAEKATRERIWELSQSAHLRDSASQSERDLYLQECIAVQRQSLQLFYRSAAGRKTVEYNIDFNGFHQGGSGMKCSLCQTIFHDQYGSRQNPTATDFKIVAGAPIFLRHALHRHTAYEPSVRCEEVLSMMARYPAFVECLKSNAFGANVSDLEEILRNKEIPELEFLSQFASTKKESWP